ncbi:aromatic ring-hydroxylating oxygenase subunit alpha [Thalassotalea mangrovi]|uniref:Aromatic ring-hydroxylating dioxygenase subunit alpha n=1 Tax=Thalassotalea mangrovi TaxID=2572245 RepID=A0A4U1B368_9GAMM|nr:aromatic ring-hydroxylating dioxygenase subunit alpha [Thalassotalea mangrovi]TKB44206.1 aromatic ring-hydroxylating dioxygenase subunit alpha [Thalassotalea mangrovi]
MLLFCSGKSSMPNAIPQSVNDYQIELALADASTPPSAWYQDDSIYQLERKTVFYYQWLLVARVDELRDDGDFLTLNIAEQPVILTKSAGKIRAFYNVCRHHGAILKGSGKDSAQGNCQRLVCPYHGWTYALDGQLIGYREFAGVNQFNPEQLGLKEIQCQQYWHWLFICFDPNAKPLFKSSETLWQRLDSLKMRDCDYYQSRCYRLQCNWKVYVDNYLDGGFHVPVLHRGLSSALDNKAYKIETLDKVCWQSCPTKPSDSDISQVRQGTANYVWLYPNLMFNCYQGVCGVMRVLPVSAQQTEVVFDYFFAPQIEDAFKSMSIKVADVVQQEDAEICESVQTGLNSFGFETGRLSVSKEAGEHLFHRLLHADLVRPR